MADRRLSLSTSQPTALEINTTNTVINSHSGDTFVGSNLNVVNTNPEQHQHPSPAINFNEDIQIRIQSTAPITVESAHRVPNVIINNFGPSINVSNEMLQDEQQMERFFQQLYNLSFQIRQNQEIGENINQDMPDNTTFVRVKSMRSEATSGAAARGHFTISIDNANYSLKKTSRRHNCWDNIVPSEYLTVSRMIYSFLMVFITVALIYLILILNAPEKIQ